MASVSFWCEALFQSEVYDWVLYYPLLNEYMVVVVVLPDPFRGMGARRNSAETQQSGHTPRSGP